MQRAVRGLHVGGRLRVRGELRLKSARVSERVGERAMLRVARTQLARSISRTLIAGDSSARKHPASSGRESLGSVVGKASFATQQRAKGGGGAGG